ncbi:DUF6932 family protein [Streptomyces flavalbus]|uniref:DUF6932 family protein n=1 Tax=Streptomyces flavalbus TaxID=2665155 RepID=A0ABW2WCF6_9ACTN
MLPAFTSNGFLPQGRYSISLSEAEEILVTAEEFRASATRHALWDGLHDYLDRFLTLEDVYADLLDGLTLVHRLWLGGSYVSTKLNPRNIDVALLIDTRAEFAVRGKPGSKWLTTAFKSRSSMRDKFGVSPVRIGYRPVVHVFRPERMTSQDRTCFTEAPSEASAAPARGCLEVRL